MGLQTANLKGFRAYRKKGTQQNLNTLAYPPVYSQLVEQIKVRSAECCHKPLLWGSRVVNVRQTRMPSHFPTKSSHSR
jgi:hypothetical protein